MSLEERGFTEEPGFAAAGTADDQDIFIPGVFGLFRTARHRDPLRLRHGDVIEKILIHVGSAVQRRCPSSKRNPHGISSPPG